MNKKEQKPHSLRIELNEEVRMKLAIEGLRNGKKLKPYIEELLTNHSKKVKP